MKGSRPVSPGEITSQSSERWGGTKFSLLHSAVLATRGLWERQRSPERYGLGSGERGVQLR